MLMSAKIHPKIRLLRKNHLALMFSGNNFGLNRIMKQADGDMSLNAAGLNSLQKNLK